MTSEVQFYHSNSGHPFFPKAERGSPESQWHYGAVWLSTHTRILVNKTMDSVFACIAETLRTPVVPYWRT